MGLLDDLIVKLGISGILPLTILRAHGFDVSNLIRTKAVIIDAGTAISSAVDLGSSILVAIIMPPEWTAANVTFRVSEDGNTFVDLYDDGGTELSVTADANRAISLNPVDFHVARYIRVRSGTGTIPVNQGGSRSISLVYRPV